jgi:hemolysin activation/secretion protein
LAVTGFASPSERQSMVVHVEAGWLEDPAPGAEFDFGLSLGPRAFGPHAFSGDRAVFATAEYRIYPFRNLLGLVTIGAAGFVDWGGAWYHGDQRRTGWNTGIGLRVGASRASDPRALRFDLSRRAAVDDIDAGWVLSVGTGLVFPSRLF